MASVTPVTVSPCLRRGSPRLELSQLSHLSPGCNEASQVVAQFCHNCHSVTLGIVGEVE